MPRALCPVASATALIVACAMISAVARGQAPNEPWRTISTEHFRVHFPRNLESLARRAGGEAERAWTRLADELHPPRTPVELVVTDNEDTSNGQATYYPSNRIVIWAHPPIDNPALRFGDDWLQQVVTHELAHAFQLDRSRGLWRAAQYVFGRHPVLFPNGHAPRWITEGIAVEYESKLGSGGRLNGSELYAALDAVALAGHSIRPGRMSIEWPYYPGGSIAYFGGAWLIHESVRNGGDTALRKFIDHVAVWPIPYMWDLHARRAFGQSFSSLSRSAGQRPEAGGQSDSADGSVYWDARAPRWRGDTVYFTALGPRDATALFASYDGETHRAHERTTTDAFGFHGREIVYGQLDLTDPYRFFSQLYIDGDRIAHTERLSSPDVRADGLIVAVETLEGTARLVLLRRDGTRVRELQPRDPDAQWSEPRWSRKGDRIAAIRWSRGGLSSIVVLDTLGRELGTYVTERVVHSHPSWDVDDRALYFTSDRDGRSAVYRVRFNGERVAGFDEVIRDPLGMRDAEISPDGKKIAVFRTLPYGYSLQIMPVPPGSVATTHADQPTFIPGRHDTIVRADGRVRNYSALRTLVPRYWEPTLATSARDNIQAGFHTSGEDVVGRYLLSVDGSWDVKSRELYGGATLTYRGRGRPVVSFAVNQGWNIFDIRDTAGVFLGDVTRRNRTAGIAASWSRPRVRNSMSLTAGAELEWRDFASHPDSLADIIDPPPPSNTLRFPSVFASLGWARSRRSALSLGPEDGFSLGTTVRRRWRSDIPEQTAATSVTATARAYHSFGLPGYTRHALALRATGGWAEERTSTVFSVGGVSGTSLELLPGYSVGDVQRTFFVRGFRSGAVQGIRAWAGSAEYRAPLARIARGIWPLPLFFQRTSLAFFGDAGSAWCPNISPTAACPSGATPKPVIASVGGELQFDMTIDYDAVNRFRLGIAAPVKGATPARAKSTTIYFTLGLPF